MISLSINVILSFVQLCSPAPDMHIVMCSAWMAQCYLDLADPKLIEDGNALEICVEQLPQPLAPN
jgi:hypothetical protein